MKENGILEPTPIPLWIIKKVFYPAANSKSNIFLLDKESGGCSYFELEDGRKKALILRA
ncbi:MAG: hypothetical protein ACE5LC_02855 [Candidatus Aminicenantales bacterium]